MLVIRSLTLMPRLIFRQRDRSTFISNSMITRRNFVGSVVAGSCASMFAAPLLAADQPRKKLAIVCTVFRMQSHAQHMGDRFLVGYPLNGVWHPPTMDVVSMYVDQVDPKTDLSHQ